MEKLSRPFLRRGPRRGILVGLVAGVAVVLGILFGAFHYSVRQRNAQAHAFLFGEVSHSLARSAMALGWRHLKDLGRRPGSPLEELLKDHSADALTGRYLPLDLLEPLSQLTRDLDPDHSIQVQARVLEAHPLNSQRDLELGYDPLEKELQVELEVEARFRGVPRKFREVRSLRVQLDLVPVLNRFTLYVGKAEVTDEAHVGYNRYANDIHGAPDDRLTDPRDNVLPLVLFNHGEAFPRLHHDLEENGAIYLGGPGPIVLQLTSGAHHRFGQYFHFYDFLSSRRASQAVFLDSSPPPYFLTPHRVGDQDWDLDIKHVLYGFFESDQGRPIQGMNRGQGLFASHKKPRNNRSSTLHLTGSTLAPSPARVYGEVYQSYPIFAGITADVDGDQRRDALVSLLPELDPEDFSLLPKLWPLPESVRDLRTKDQRLRIDPEVIAWEKLFPDYATYAQYQSLLLTDEPYNRSLDFLFSRGQFPPRISKLDPDLDYPHPGREVEWELVDPEGKRGPYFRGDLARLTNRLFSQRATWILKDQAEFEELFRVHETGRLNLQGHVQVLEGDLLLPKELEVLRGGSIQVAGDIHFDGIQCNPGERLSLISRHGNLLSPFDHSGAHRPVEADLIALEGELRSTQKNHPVAVRGTVAVRTLRPEGIPSGGTLSFDPRSLPTQARRQDLARIHLADRSQAWAQ